VGEESAVLGVLEAVQAVEKSLIELGHDVVLLPLLPPVEEIKNKLLNFYGIIMQLIC
jgi:hypothetical protein